jgi:hypothetical protein
VTRYWRVEFAADGAISGITEVYGPGHEDWVIVEAPDQERAQRAALGIYCARKKKLARERNYAAGNCACGRKNNRADQLHPKTGKPLLSCSTCSARHQVHLAGHRQRKAEGVTDHQRDESARVAATQTRQRDRRGEIRLETLLEVRDQWINQRNVALFGKWLIAEIETITGAKAS